MTTRQRSCDERVDSELADRIEDLRRVWDAYCRGEGDEAEEFHEYGLTFDYVPAGTFGDQEEGYFRYQLSWGGPSDEFRFFVDAGGHLHRIEYWFLDWFDGASRRLAWPEKDLLTEIFQWFDEVGATRAELEKARERG